MDTSVSVIIPVYNGERYLVEAVDSVFDQGHASIEVIVVDDGSTDATSAVCATMAERITYLHQRNAGAAAARNAGIEAAGGNVIGFLDADDVWTANSLAMRLAALDVEPKMVFGLAENFFADDLSDEERSQRAVPLGEQRGFNPSAMITTRSTFAAVGLFDPEIAIGEFLDWYMRARDVGVPEELVDQVVARRRIHASNTGILRRDEGAGYLQLLRRSLARRRDADNG